MTSPFRRKKPTLGLRSTDSPPKSYVVSFRVSGETHELYQQRLREHVDIPELLREAFLGIIQNPRLPVTHTDIGDQLATFLKLTPDQLRTAFARIIQEGAGHTGVGAPPDPIPTVQLQQSHSEPAIPEVGGGRHATDQQGDGATNGGWDPLANWQ